MTTTLWVYHAPYTVDFELVSQLIQSVYKYESGENDNDIDVVSNCINESGLVYILFQEITLMLVVLKISNLYETIQCMDFCKESIY